MSLRVFSALSLRVFLCLVIASLFSALSLRAFSAKQSVSLWEVIFKLIGINRTDCFAKKLAMTYKEKLAMTYIGTLQ